MSYIEFDREQLINLKYSLSRELLRTNRAGAYACSTLVNCNTRKYHGMLVAPQLLIDNDNHVILSSIDETVIQCDTEFNLGIHKYPGDNYFPKGHKYLEKFEAEPIPIYTYRIGGVLLTKEMLFSRNSDQMIIRYTLVEAKSPTILRFRPFLAFRSVHKLSKSNVFANRKFEPVKNGARFQMYQGYTPLFVQFNKECEYTHVPDWYYNIEYLEEYERGYDYQEDLFVPGFFDISIKTGESIYISCNLEEINPAGLKKAFDTELKKRIPRSNFENCLKNAAEQFIVHKGSKTEIIAGYPWFGRWGRDTFIALPGLTLVTGDFKTCKAVLDTMLEDLNGPLFPNIGTGKNAVYNTVDASLWFFWALQQYAIFTQSQNTIWKEYGKKMLLILNGYRNGTMYNIKMHDNGMIWASENGKALTWMDAIVCGKPVTPRSGYAVEINALWYNAIMFSLEVAKYAKDEEFIAEWQPLADKFPENFKAVFWSKNYGWLADYVNDNYKDFSVRPNMIFATSLPYTPVSLKIRQLILETVKKELLTPRGLRTLSPTHTDYKEHCVGNQAERDSAYHQGTVWPWLIGHFAEGYQKVHGRNALPVLKMIFENFEETILEHGIGTISEIYDGNPPHKARGTISQAWSVSEILRLGWIIQKQEAELEKLSKSSHI